MEKIYSILIVSVLSTCFLFAQEPVKDATKSRSKFKIEYRELNVEIGANQAMIFNDTINQKFGSTPYLTVYYNNFISERLMFSMFLSPLAFHITKDDKSIFQERYTQIETGITGSISPIHNLWVSAGVGYAYRLFQDYKSGANSWTETSFSQPALFVVGSVEYWVRTNVGLRVTSFASVEGYGFKVGAFINVRPLIKKLKFRKSN